MGFFELDARTVADQVRAGGLKATEVLDETLDRIARLNEPLNAYVFLDEERARRTADHVDTLVASGVDPGPLAGVPLAIKELESVDGWPRTSASTAFHDRLGTVTTTMTSRLLDAGAVPVGLTASPELGLLYFTNSVLHGPTRNPWNLERTPGGSSGGAGAALAAGLAHLATGSDSGGSIRLPAGYCGVVGVKGTFGRVARGPGWVGSSNLTHYGPLARTVGDAARFLDCVTGPSPHDPASLPAPAERFEPGLAHAASTVAGLRVGVVLDNGIAAADPGVAAVVEGAAAVLIDSAGMTRVDVSITSPSIEEVGGALLYADLDPEVLAVLPEIIANLMQTEGAEPLFQLAFDPAGLTLEGLTKAFQFRHDLNLQLAAAFDQVDLLLVPTSPVAAFGARGPVPLTAGGRETGGATTALFTSMFNLSGHPAVSVPAGIVDTCPAGMQIVARRHEDHVALAAAAVYEEARPWPHFAPYAGGPQ